MKMEEWRKVTGQTYPVERFVNDILFNRFMERCDAVLDLYYDNETFSYREWVDEEDDYWNFWHKPSDLRIGWYKYPLRSAYANMQLTPEMLWAVLTDCSNSVKSFIVYDLPKKYIFWEGLK